MSHLLRIFCLFAWAIAGALSGAQPEFELRVVPGVPEAGLPLPRWRVLVLVRSRAAAAREVTPQIAAENAKLVRVEPASMRVVPGETAAFRVQVAGLSGSKPASMKVSLKEAPGSTVPSALPLGMELRSQSWLKSGTLPAGSAPPGEPAAWTSTQMPARSTRGEPGRFTAERGLTWFRTRVTIPSSWRGQALNLTLRIEADFTTIVLNGRSLTRTAHGELRDRRLVYRLPPESIHWGRSNELSIGLEQEREPLPGFEGFFATVGCTLYDAPLTITAGELGSHSWPFDDIGIQPESRRAAPGPVGARLPLRPMTVRDGVLRYPDGQEVALWGTQYYPQSIDQYTSLRKLGIDPRRSADEDLEDFVQTGIDILRIHVFDSEITDAQGNLIVNDHLDVLDYLIAQCNRRGIYLMLTPIAWWGSPEATRDSFSRNTPMQAMHSWPAMWPIQANYLRQFLSHKNPYSGNRLADEPSVVLLEVMNEPLYWNYTAVAAGVPEFPRLGAEAAQRGMDGVRGAWFECMPQEWRNPVTFAWFRYGTLRRYIDTMIEAIRSTGAKQPIGFAYHYARDPELVQAIADSRSDAVTLGGYPGGLSTIQDDRNLIARLDAPDTFHPIDPRLAGKARLVYEYDAAGMRRQADVYPVLALQWRRLGVQVACQFQYDAKALAHVNWAWGVHYLNLWHTPEKFASFLIGGEVFRRLPRGARFDLPPDDQVFGPAAASFHRNTSVLAAGDTYMQASAAGWQPLPVPENPRHILSVGTCPYFEYEGTGIVDLSIEGPAATLRIYPDLERRPVKAPTGKADSDMMGTLEQPLTVLHEHEHPFRLLLRGWGDSKVQRSDNGTWTPVPVVAGSFTARAGVYRLVK